MLPADHPILSPRTLEPEAEGLLDRILSIFQENSTDALLIDATLNGFATLLTTRMTVSHKIINAILNFNIFKLANSPMTTTNKILIRSMEKTVSRLLNHWLKRHDLQMNKRITKHRRVHRLTILPRFQQNQLAQRVTEYLHRLQQTHVTVFNEASRKRPAPAEPTDGLNEAKRQRLGAQVPAAPQGSFPPAPIPSTQIPEIPVDQRAKLLALTDDPRIFNFNIYQIPFHLIVQMIVAILHSTPQPAIDAAINASRNQILQYVASETEANNRIPLDVPADDDDQYDPLDLKVSEEMPGSANEMDGSYITGQQGPGFGGAQLPSAPLLDHEKLKRLHANIVERLLKGLEAQRAAAASSASPAKKQGGQAPTNHDRTPYLQFLVRLATRVPIGLEVEDEKTNAMGYNYADAIRERLLQYVMQGWKTRIDVAITWLTDEWMTDTVVAQEKAKKTSKCADEAKENGAKKEMDLPHYTRWLHKLLDELSAFIGAELPEVKILIRLLSEIPHVSREVIEKVKRLAEDPERIGLVVPALRYLVLYRVPVREMCLDAMENMYREFDGARQLVRKDLARWRPQVLEAEEQQGKNEEVSDGVKAEG
jgi:symplekin